MNVYQLNCAFLNAVRAELFISLLVAEGRQSLYEAGLNYYFSFLLL